jgi:hypothetical protein
VEVAEGGKMERVGLWGWGNGGERMEEENEK